MIYTVLDKGSVELIDSMGSDNAVVKSARVSYNKDLGESDKDKDNKLIKYLMEHGHSTPFESTVLTYRVTAPIFVIRQWFRHRTQSYNETSARYRKASPEFYIPKEIEIGTNLKYAKQGRNTAELNPNRAYIVALLTKSSQDAFETYENLINSGTPKEVARIILPVNLYSSFYTTVNLHNLFKFLRERLHENAQYEIREYAKVLLKIAKKVAPQSVMEFENKIRGEVL